MKFWMLQCFFLSVRIRQILISIILNIWCTYFDSYQLAAFEIQIADRQENEMVVGRRQNEIVAAALEVIALL